MVSSVCTRCHRREAFYLRESSGEALCRQCFIKSIEEKFIRNIRENDMIKYGDSIGVAVSGGKDSLVMLKLLVRNLRKPPLSYVRRILVFTVDEELEYTRHKLERVSYIREVCDRYGLEYKVYTVSSIIGVSAQEVYEKLKESGKNVNMCTICGVFRRRVMNEIARREGLSKIMTAHNLDDDAQTVLLNVFSNDIKRFKWFGPVTGEDVENFVPRIKPLRNIREEEIAVYAYVMDIPMLERECPYVKNNPRYTLKFLLAELERRNPNIKYMIVSFGDSLSSILKESRYFERKVRTGRCSICGMPTTGDICRTCELIRDAGLLDRYLLAKRS
ncbi:MAG: TIGR00269 family protein [Crenarchaeota archaeon]|nr:TIGR00269 family protein [Thermoproteota archaeon]